MSDASTDSTYVVSFKTSTGYDASLIVARGETVQELADNITSLHDIVSLVVQTENLVHTAYAAQQPTQAAPAAVAAAPAAVASVTPLMTCLHGKRTRREGNSSKGPWVGHFCPQPKGSADQCAAIFEDK